MEQNNDALDPRIQIELENLNTATEEINKLEIELEEANSTFRILLNESTRRLKLLSKKLGSCIEKSRPYYESVEKARLAQIECQLAAAKFQRANEIHTAAKETVALAEDRFMSNSHNWPFDNAWQEMLNHATIKVMEAEKQKAESHAEHQIKAHIFSMAESKMQQIEERQRRNIQKSRPYFEEKQLCQDQLQTQKDRIQELQLQIQATKASYSTSLKNLEQISEEIHKTRGHLPITPPGPREPGVGAELCTDEDDDEIIRNRHMGLSYFSPKNPIKNLNTLPISELMAQYENDFSLETVSLDTTSMLSEDKDDDYDENASGCGRNSRTELQRSDYPTQQQYDMTKEELVRRAKVMLSRPIEGDDGQKKDCWESDSMVYGNGSNNRTEPQRSDYPTQQQCDMSAEELVRRAKVMLARPIEGDDGQTKDCWESESMAYGCGSNSRTEPQRSNNATQQQHELSLEELRQRVKVLAAQPLEGGDSQTKDCWESELNETVNKLDRLMMLQEKTPNATGPKTSTSSITILPTTTSGSSIFTTSSMAPTIATAANAASSTTKTFLNNSFQAVQQKMEELLPATQQTSAAVIQNISSMKELPLLSRISNEISANTANTVKVLKRRLSLN